MIVARYSLTPRGPFGSPPRAGTLWGQLCWAMREAEGEAALAAFLDAYRAGAPPLLLSDPLPAGWLPRPVLPPLSSAERDAFARERAGEFEDKKGKGPAPEIQALQRLKALAKAAWIKAEALAALAAGLSERAVLERLWRSCPQGGFSSGQPPDFQREYIPRVAIDRARGRAAQGQLFAAEAHFPPRPANGAAAPPGPPFALHLLVRLSGDFSPERFLGLLRLVGLQGYGRDASTGMGRFDAAKKPPLEWPEIESNAALALSAFVPAPADPVRGWWSVRTHFGRAGNRFSRPSGEADWTPFKKPMLLLERGAVLAGPHRGFFGALAEGVHTDARIVDYGHALALPVRLAGEEGGGS